MSLNVNMDLGLGLDLDGDGDGSGYGNRLGMGMVVETGESLLGPETKTRGAPADRPTSERQANRQA